MEISGQPQYDLQWSFRPIIYMMRAFGVDLNLARKKLSIGLILLRIFGVSALLYANIIPSINLTCKILKSDCQVGSYERRGTKFYFLQRIFFDFTSVLLDLQLLFSASAMWKSVWKAAEDMEMRLKYHPGFYQQLRKISTILVLVILTLVLQSLQTNVNRNSFETFDSVAGVNILASINLRRLFPLWCIGSTYHCLLRYFENS